MAALPLARLPVDGDALREGAGNSGNCACDGTQRAVSPAQAARFIECGDPHYGFARVYCAACGHDTRLAYSCKTRTLCPSFERVHFFCTGRPAFFQSSIPPAR